MSEIIWLDENETEPRKQNFAIRQLLERASGLREVLAANRTYYVRTDGSDSNTGLVNSAAGAFLTIQKPIDVIASDLDMAGYTITIQIADGTYTAGAEGKVNVGQASVSSLLIQGNDTTPANVIVSLSSGISCFNAGASGVSFRVSGVKVINSTASNGRGISAQGGGYIVAGKINFGACTDAHILSYANGLVVQVDATTISGGSLYHLWSGLYGMYVSANQTVTVSGTPAFSGAFAYADAGLITTNNTYSGSATGVRYSSVRNGVIDTTGGGANYFPGNSPGSTATGGQYA